MSEPNGVTADNKEGCPPSDESKADAAWTRLELLEPLETSILMTAPPILTVNFYQMKDGGIPPATWIRDRVEEIVDKNPWLAGRLRTEGRLGPALYIPSDCKPMSLRSMVVEGKADVGLRIGMPYSEFSKIALDRKHDLVLKKSHEVINKDEPLFRVTVVPAGPGNFAMAVAMDHVIGDGHTYYRILGMLDESAEIVALEPTRNQASTEATKEAIGRTKYRWFTSSFGLISGAVCGALFRRSNRPLCRYVAEDWVSHKKEVHRPEYNNGIPFVSTNDILTSWLFGATSITGLLTNINMRGRLQGVTDNLAGNYEVTMVHFCKDAGTPADVRKSISNPPDFTCGDDSVPAVGAHAAAGFP